MVCPFVLCMLLWHYRLVDIKSLLQGRVQGHQQRNSVSNIGTDRADMPSNDIAATITNVRVLRADNILLLPFGRTLVDSGVLVSDCSLFMSIPSVLPCSDMFTTKKRFFFGGPNVQIRGGPNGRLEDQEPKVPFAPTPGNITFDSDSVVAPDVLSQFR